MTIPADAGCHRGVQLLSAKPCCSLQVTSQQGAGTAAGSLVAWALGSGAVPSLTCVHPGPGSCQTALQHERPSFDVPTPSCHTISLQPLQPFGKKERGSSWERKVEMPLMWWNKWFVILFNNMSHRKLYKKLSIESWKKKSIPPSNPQNP